MIPYYDIEYKVINRYAHGDQNLEFTKDES